MRSMTGFGSVQIPTQHARIRIEVSSVNKRGLEVIVFTPGELTRLERQIREEVAGAVARGKVTVAVMIESSPTQNVRSLDLEKAASYAAQLRTAGKRLGVSSGPTLPRSRKLRPNSISPNRFFPTCSAPSNRTLSNAAIKASPTSSTTAVVAPTPSVALSS